MLSKAEAEVIAGDLLNIQAAERTELDMLRDYWRGKQPLPVIPSGVPSEVVQMAAMSRVNMCKLVVDVPAQSMFVDGFRDAGDDSALWSVWQANKMDAHQSAIYRAAFAYGTSYLKVVPGKTTPVMRGLSPRSMTAVYDEDPDWPVFALETVNAHRRVEWRLYDDEGIYTLVNDPEVAKARNQAFAPVLASETAHGAGVCPIVRFRNVDELDGDTWSEIGAIIPLQDQLDFTTFDLLVAQHFGAFRQRYIMGWLADTEAEKIKASASRMLTFDDPDVRVGEFDQTDLSGYLKSRQATVEQFGVVSQVPPHNLLGQMVNLSAEALVAAEVGHSRKMAEREIGFGESIEQAFGLAGVYTGVPVSDGAQVRWRDTEARSFAATVDGLAKLSQSLSVPVEALWEKIPGVTAQDVTNWKAMRLADDAFAALDAELRRQASPADVVNN